MVGNHYGTPKPWASRPRSVNSQLGSGDGGIHQTGESMSTVGGNQIQQHSYNPNVLPGMHPSSEGKRRRNRSNVEALGACDGDDEPPSPTNINRNNTNTNTSPSSSYPANPNSVVYSSRAPTEELGPLPPNWEMSYTEKGEVYFIE